MNINKGHGVDLCKSHSARSEKEFCRVCPSNLNKKELENIYFTLLENNLDLKTTINNQREKIKILSTKLQRLTALQKTYLGKEPKECCGSKAVINEQKECISELKRSNQCLSERVRQLNMRLCSAKQFLKRSPFQSTSRCNRCSNKNVSMSALMTKASDTNLRTRVNSSQYLIKDIVSSRTADNDITSHDKGVQYNICDENKCRDRIEELERKNKDLQEELSQMKETRASMTSQLERDLCDLRAECVRIRSERTFAADRTEQLRAQLGEVTMRLGSADLRCDELSVELAIEKRKVTELETRLKAADMSSRIASAIEAHLTSTKMASDQVEVSKHEKHADTGQFLEVQSPAYRPKAAVRTKIPHVQLDDGFKNSDDSGYTESNRSQEVDGTKASTYLNQVLLEKIADLQNQINKLKSFKKNCNKSANELLNVTDEMNVEKTQMYPTVPVNQEIDENTISESSESVITEKRTNANIATKQSKGILSNENEEVNKPAVVDSKYKNNESEKQENNLYDEIELGENIKRFRRRSKDVSNILINDRKHSLQHSRDLLKEQRLKTGSLDENRVVNIENVTVGKDKRFGAHQITTRSSNEKEISTSHNDTVNRAKTISSAKNNECILQERLDQSDKETVGNIPIKKDADSGVNNCASGEQKTDSDSSKGTYSIHRNENEAKLKTNTKLEYHVLNKENKNNHIIRSRKGAYALAADVERVLSSATVNDNLVHRRRSTPCETRTYVKVPRDLSPDGTEYEISSMSDLPDERTVCSRSPGEERRTTASESRTDTATDYGSLSEGELPHLRDLTTLSDGEKPVTNRMGKSLSVPAWSEACLAAVERELRRCSALLLRPAPHAPPSSALQRPQDREEALIK